MFEGKFEQGAESGKHTHYYENGQTKSYGVYKFGQKEGDWITYSELGEVISVVTYKAGEVIRVDGEKIEQPEKEDGDKHQGG